jgi:hypothetical protein
MSEPDQTEYAGGSDKEWDEVAKPRHYASGDIECIDAIKAAMGKEKFIGFLWGNALKYLWRHEHKGRRQDLAKAAWYMQRLDAEMYDS